MTKSVWTFPEGYSEEQRQEVIKKEAPSELTKAIENTQTRQEAFGEFIDGFETDIMTKLNNLEALWLEAVKKENNK